MNTSLLEIFSWPLRVLFGYNVRQPYIYEHVFTPLLVACIVPTEYYLYTFIVVFNVHVIIKELIVDQIKNHVVNWENVTERCYGMLLMGMYYAKEIWF